MSLISGFQRNSLEGDGLRSAPCLKDCFNPCICWSFLVSPCLSSVPKSFLSWAKGSVKAFVGSNPRSNRKKTNPQQRCLLPMAGQFIEWVLVKRRRGHHDAE